MLPVILTLVAGGALAAHAVLLWRLLWGRAANLRAREFADQIEKLVRAGNSTRAVKLCCALDARSPVGQLGLFMLSLELPAATRKSAATDYRGAPSVERFGDVVGDVIGREVERLGRTVRPHVLVAAGCGFFAATTAGAALLAGVGGGWRLAAMCVGAAAMIGVAIGLNGARRLQVGVGVLRDRLLPYLRPVEEMTDDQKDAAVAARDRLLLPGAETPSRSSASSGSRTSYGVIAVVIVAVAGVGVVLLVAPTNGTSSPGLAGPALVARVTRTTGDAPVAAGATCSVVIFDNRNDDTYDCRVHVQCGPTDVYGTSSAKGYTNCVWDGAIAVAAHDRRWDEGDPALRLDRRIGSVEVRDETWTVTLEVVPALPDAGALDASASDRGA